MARKRPVTPVAAAAPYQPTEREQKAIASYSERKAKRIPAPPLKVFSTTTVKGKLVGNISIDHVDALAGEALFCDSLGTGDSNFASLISEQLGLLSVAGVEINAHLLNAHLSLVRGIGPQDELEAILATQMAAVHVLTMGSAARLHQSTDGQHRELATNQLTKLARTFAAQVETLKRDRASGEQKVVVEHRHYHLAPGAQAVFGDVTAPGGGGVQQKIEDQSHETDRMLLSELATVPGPIEADGVPVPGASAEGQTGVPIPWRPSRSAPRAV